MSQELLEGKNISELREIAKAYGISSAYKYKKNELIDVIVRSLTSGDYEINDDVSIDVEPIQLSLIHI